MDFRSKIRDVVDFPKPGIVFKDITPLLRDPAAFHSAMGILRDHIAPQKPDAIVAIESRGFLTGSILAYELGVPLVVVRKPGKLPAKTISVKYALEYGEDELQIHADALHAGDRVIIADDLLATGGTVSATCQLVQKLGATPLEAVFLVELFGLGGREKLAPLPIFSLMDFDVDE